MKVSIRFRGRQIAHSDIGLKVMQDFIERTKEYCTVERRPTIEGRNMLMILVPKTEKAIKAEKAAAAKEYAAKKGIVADEEGSSCMSGIPSRPYCKGRNYDPNRYNSN